MAAIGLSPLDLALLVSGYVAEVSLTGSLLICNKIII